MANFPDSDSDDDLMSTPPEIVHKAAIATQNLLPKKSSKLYNKQYTEFIDWRKNKNITSFSENVLLVYFEELSVKLKSSTLWSRYSILKSTLYINHEVDISSHAKLKALLKRNSEVYLKKKSKTFSKNELKTFIDEAPDDHYLLIKVVFIFGVMGACRKHELHEMQFDHVKDDASSLIVTVPNKKTKIIRTFTVTGNYINLRP